jgi:hypothetical protein
MRNTGSGTDIDSFRIVETNSLFRYGIEGTAYFHSPERNELRDALSIEISQGYTALEPTIDLVQSLPLHALNI